MFTFNGGCGQGAFDCAGSPIDRSTILLHSRHPSFSSDKSWLLISIGASMLNVLTDSVTKMLAHATHLLLCAATAYESADHLSGDKRDLAFSVVHSMDMARTALEETLLLTEASR
jgi:hypothetical protein